MAESLLSSLKNEITRLARKVVKSEISPLQSNSATHRRHIAELRRRIDAMDREIKQLRKGATQQAGAAAADQADAPVKLRFRAAGLKTHRAMLGISAENYAKLIGVSGLTIYNWESGTNRPRASQLPAIAAVRRMGKREALARLEQLSK